MKDFTVNNLTQRVTEAYTANTETPRSKKLLSSLIKYLHAFVKEVDLTEAEWFEAIQFLTDTGRKCDDKRQEFILLSDVLGVSMLVDAINHPKGGDGTESTVLGPFYVPGSPEMPVGGDIRGRHLSEAKPCLVVGRVTDEQGTAIIGATIDVWQTSANGMYDVQDSDAPEWNLRGRFKTDRNGEYTIVTEKPVSYAVPTDGPVGKLFDLAGRHAFRPAHIHFKVSAAGCEPLTTHVFVNGDKYLDSDAVFATKESLVGDFEICHDEQLARRFDIETPFTRLKFDFGLMSRAS